MLGIAMIAKKIIPAPLRPYAEAGFLFAMNFPLYRPIHNAVGRRRFAGAEVRKLEIGPGYMPLSGFESLNVVYSRGVTYMASAAKPLPFEDGTYDLVYASHVLEHIAWYRSEDVLREWVRILKPGGSLEIWVPNQLKLARSLVNFEDHGVFETDGWSRWGADKDIAMWFSGHTYAFSDLEGDPNHPNWHHASFTPRFLMNLFKTVGLVDIQEMDRSEIRGYDRGWINLGVKGTKP